MMNVLFGEIYRLSKPAAERFWDLDNTDNHKQVKTLLHKASGRPIEQYFITEGLNSSGMPEDTFVLTNEKHNDIDDYKAYNASLRFTSDKTSQMTFLDYVNSNKDRINNIG